MRRLTILPTLASLALAALPACSPGASATRPAAAAGVAAAGAGGDAPSLYDLGSTWVDQRGDTTGLADLRGPVRIVTMIYTSCAITCPLVIADLKRIEASIPESRRGAVRFVLVSLDPARDTPGRLAAWARDTELDPAHWTLLAGTDDAVRELAAALDVRYQALPGGEVAHTNDITVLDAAGAPAHRQTRRGDGVPETIAAVRRLIP